MAGLALCAVAFSSVLVLADPRCPNRVQAMRPAIDGAGHGDVAGGAFGYHARMSLEFLALNVVVAERAGEFCMRRTMAGRALEAAVAHGETIQ